MDEAIIERAEALAAGGRSMDARAGEGGVRTSPEAATIAGARSPARATIGAWWTRFPSTSTVAA